MHELFADWYRTADPMADRETITKRWAATSELQSSLTKEGIVELASSLFRVGMETPEWFRKCYKKHDDAMPTRAIEQELRVLSAVLLRLSLEENSENDAEGAENDAEGDESLSIVAALSLLVGAFGMKDEPPWIKEHLHAAASTLSEIGRDARQLKNTLSVEEPLAIEAVNDALSRAHRQIEIVSESNNYLWWAFTKHSRILNGSYPDQPASIVAIAAPLDIFGHALLIPVAPETEILLLRVLREAQDASKPALSFKSYLNGFGRERAKKSNLILPAKCAALCPIMWSILAIGDGKSWITEFEKTFGFRTATITSPESIAIQLIRELSLVRSFSETED